MQPIRNDELRWILVDFDKVSCQSGEPPLFEMGDPMPGAVEALKTLHERGWKITIFTARHYADYRPIEDWCDRWGIPARRIICGKPLAMWQIDDRAIEFNPERAEESWTRAVDKIGFYGEKPNLTVHLPEDPSLANICDDCQ